VALKRAGCWVALKRTSVEWCGKMVPQTSLALFEMTTVCLNTSFESCSPLVNGIIHNALQLTHAMSQPGAVATRLFSISLGSAVTFFR